MKSFQTPLRIILRIRKSCTWIAGRHAGVPEFDPSYTLVKRLANAAIEKHVPKLIRANVVSHPEWISPEEKITEALRTAAKRLYWVVAIELLSTSELL